ncbi:Alpha-tocopherol transfer protein-like [Eumeta japonica]|uniref:Alpha-tocopherol transfer protein-like n=1 Tax=Eumeta variegata TaxID=151549 RepID=A0A4C1ZGN9_EUMVA|nr:Alpha-tocopherol transfer protein-like [Eumeta japonica]
MPQHAVQPFPVSEEYVRNPEIKPEDIAKFRQWVRTQPHLPDQHISGTAPNSSVLDISLPWWEYPNESARLVPRLGYQDFQENSLDGCEAHIGLALEPVVDFSAGFESSSGLVSDPCSIVGCTSRFDLHGALFPDLDLVLTYHCCDRSAEVAKQVLDLNLTLRTMSPIFAGRDVDDKGLERAYHTALLSILPARSPEGYAVLYTCLLDCDPKNFILCDMAKAFMMMVDLYQLEEGTWPGLLIAMDMRGVQLAHLSCIDLKILQQVIYYLQEAFLAKLKGIHLLNAPSFTEKLMMIIRPFMKKQLLDMMHIHQPDSKVVDELIPKAALPKESGGQHKDISTWIEELWQKIRANREYFAAERERRVNEAKRPGRPRSVTDLFGGVEGSFKKLDID